MTRILNIHTIGEWDAETEKDLVPTWYLFFDTVILFLDIARFVFTSAIY